MTTVIRPELSKKNKYWIDKRRYYELKYFCLQYPLWKHAYDILDGTRLSSYDLTSVANSLPGDPTGKCAEERLIYLERMILIEQTANKADPDLGEYILAAVTQGLTYETCKTRFDIPCSRDTYYDRYRKFFWLLNKVRD